MSTTSAWRKRFDRVAVEGLRSSEMGSWFHHEDVLPTVPVSSLSSHALYGSGRDALRSLLRLWADVVTRIALPTYYCHDVTEAIGREIEVRLYECSPTADDCLVDLDDDEAAVTVEYFGCASRVQVAGGRVALDRTMAPWSSSRYGRRPDAIFGSLRKAFPVPDGGFLSLADHSGVIPEPTSTPGHELLVEEVLSAMKDKAAYLKGSGVRKSSFLDVLNATDDRILESRISGVSAYTRQFANCIDMHALATRRRRNLSTLREIRPSGWEGVGWINSVSHAVLLCDTPELRRGVRKELAELEVYTPTLWSTPAYVLDRQAIDFSERHLVLHIDHRYSDDDMRDLAHRMDQAVRNVRGTSG